MAYFSTIIFLLLSASLQSVMARTAGCGKTPPSSGTKSIGNRRYTLQVPANYDSNKEYMLIFGFHWLNGNMNTVAPGYYGLRALAGESAIFVAPDGINAGWANGGGSDVTFVDQILTEVQNSLCIDTTKRFATGFSYGGAMSNAVACARPTDQPDIFRAVSVIAGAELSGCAGGTTPVAYLGIHGAADNVLSISQGRALRDRFLRVNGCQSKNAPDPSPGASQRIKTEYSCRDGYPVWWIGHGGGHVGDANDSQGNWMARETWDFFTLAIYGGSGGGGGGGAPPTTGPPSGQCAAKFGQCGGQGWTGATCCQSGSTCNAQNQW
ncbi:ferulic acid esterase A (fungal cellulose binding domain-containing protein) [Colletotrichum tofieldiae]|uniref:feruloyl esterase n=1 Tax=Colletotrichum tofieldiae TaxID=708197 RepID=A0A166NB60_9PEZI|nr:ferulic acid esterase A (fungal cellulose binding domain-containing protein) [Colletotrichum tofieldiae]